MGAIKIVVWVKSPDFDDDAKLGKLGENDLKPGCLAMAALPGWKSKDTQHNIVLHYVQ